MRNTLLAVLAALCVAFPVPTRTATAGDWVTVRVKRGDTLSRIARRYGVTVKDIRRQNRKTLRASLRPGMRLKVRRKKAKAAAKRAKAKTKRAQKSTRTTAETKAHASEKRSARKSNRKKRKSKRGRWVTYKTKRGDTAQRIAKRFGVSVRDLKRQNRRLKRVGSKKRLRRGMRLRIKRRGTHRLVGGVLLPRKGVGYVRMRPERSWGTPCTIELIQSVYADFQERNPGSVPGMIADISDEDGGWLPPHKSHQRGVDIDVSYYKVGNERLRGLEVVTPETIDIVKTWELIRLFVNTGHVDMIFMDHELQAVLHRYLRRQGYTNDQLADWLQYPRAKGDRRGMIRHSPGHHHHLHIRFDCIDPNNKCERPAVAIIQETKDRRRLIAQQGLAEVDRVAKLDPPRVPPTEARPAAVPTARASKPTARTANLRPTSYPAAPKPQVPAVKPAVRAERPTRDPFQGLFGDDRRGAQRPAAPQRVRSPRAAGARGSDIAPPPTGCRDMECPNRMSRLGATLL